MFHCFGNTNILKQVLAYYFFYQIIYCDYMGGLHRYTSFYKVVWLVTF